MPFPALYRKTGSAAPCFCVSVYLFTLRYDGHQVITPVGVISPVALVSVVHSRERDSRVVHVCQAVGSVAQEGAVLHRQAEAVGVHVRAAILVVPGAQRVDRHRAAGCQVQAVAAVAGKVQQAQLGAGAAERGRCWRRH